MQFRYNHRTESVPQLVDHLCRHQSGQVVATLTRLFGPQHLDLAEDVVQETLIKALRQWSYRGIPENPAGWMMTVARNHALDIFRREQRFRVQAALSLPLRDHRTATRLRSRTFRTTRCAMICCG